MSKLINPIKTFIAKFPKEIAKWFFFIVVVSFLGGWASQCNRATLNVRGELIVSEVSFRVRAPEGSTQVPLPALTQIQLTSAELVDSSELRVINPSLPDTLLSGLPRRSSFQFSSTVDESPLVWLDALALADSGFVRVVAGLEDTLGVRLTVSSLEGQGQMGFIMHRDTAAELKIRGNNEPLVVRLERGASVTALPRKMMQLRGRLERPEPGFSVSDGIPVHELLFNRTHTQESARSRSSIVSGRLEFDEDWLNPDRRGEAGEVPGFNLDPGDHLQVAAPDLTINDIEFVMVNGRLHFKLIFSGKTNVLRTRSGNKLKDGRLTRAEYFALHPVWGLFFNVVYEVSVLMAGLLSLWWMYLENKKSDKEGRAGNIRRGIGRRLRKRIRKYARRRR